MCFGEGKGMCVGGGKVMHIGKGESMHMHIDKGKSTDCTEEKNIKLYMSDIFQL